ncbi:MAG TPA: hypothetical protein VFV02_08565, partial [Acidimicrobiales bacterium]|nr:hypothetical protein [Acidimicrobiales bacterium]
MHDDGCDRTAVVGTETVVGRGGAVVVVVGIAVVGTVVVAGRVVVVDAGGRGMDAAVRDRVSLEHPGRPARATSVVPITSGHTLLGFTRTVAMSASHSSRR